MKSTPEAEGVDVAAAAAAAGQVLAAVEHAVIGKRQVLQRVLAALLGNGHVLLEDLPGLGKTLLARSFAQAMGLAFRRIQFTPDLLPADITGAMVLDPVDRTFAFREGPLFTQLLLADEINRTPPKTQAALLEAMQERQVTVDGRSRLLPRPFLVLATANPVDMEGAFPLPEAQLDRFLARVSLGYPEAEDETAVVLARVARGKEDVVVPTAVDETGLLRLQRVVEATAVDRSIAGYVVELARATRRHPAVLAGASPRGSLAVVQMARGWAVLHGRDYVLPEDVQAVANDALAHRLLLRPEAWMQGRQAEEVVRKAVDGVPAPTGRNFEHAAAPTGR